MTPVSLGIDMAQPVQWLGDGQCTGFRILFFTTPGPAPVPTQTRIQGVPGGFSSNKRADA